MPKQPHRRLIVNEMKLMTHHIKKICCKFTSQSSFISSLFLHFTRCYVNYKVKEIMKKRIKSKLFVNLKMCIEVFYFEIGERKKKLRFKAHRKLLIKI